MSDRKTEKKRNGKSKTVRREHDIESVAVKLLTSLKYNIYNI